MKTWKLVSGIISIVWGIGLFIVAIKNGAIFLPIMDKYLDVFGNLGGFIAVCLFAGACTLSGGQKILESRCEDIKEAKKSTLMVILYFVIAAFSSLLGFIGLGELFLTFLWSIVNIITAIVFLVKY